MPRDGRPTRERILATAERLVIDNGFAATSLDQVIAESRTSKGAFFHHFGSKLDLARALVDRYAAADVAHLNSVIAESQATTDDPAERVITFLRIFENGADELMAAQSSCMYVAMLTERQLVQSATSARIADAVVTWRTTLSRMLHDAFEARGIAGDIDADALADHFFVTFEGAFILCRSTHDSGHMRAQLTVLRQLMEALFQEHARAPGGLAQVEISPTC